MWASDGEGKVEKGSENGEESLRSGEDTSVRGEGKVWREGGGWGGEQEDRCGMFPASFVQS